MLPGVKKVIEESAYRACLCHLLLRGVYARAISCAVKELAGALRVGKRAVSSQGRKVSVGVANCLQGWAMKEEMIARILSLQPTYTHHMCPGGCLYPLLRCTCHVNRLRTPVRCPEIYRTFSPQSASESQRSLLRTGVQHEGGARPPNYCQHDRA